jgi:hypothetical protein
MGASEEWGGESMRTMGHKVLERFRKNGSVQGKVCLRFCFLQGLRVQNTTEKHHLACSQLKSSGLIYRLQISSFLTSQSLGLANFHISRKEERVGGWERKTDASSHPLCCEWFLYWGLQISLLGRQHLSHPAPKGTGTLVTDSSPVTATFTVSGLDGGCFWIPNAECLKGYPWGRKVWWVVNQV